MKDIIRQTIGRYIKLNPSLSDDKFVEMLSAEIADEVQQAIDQKRKDEKQTEEK